MKKHILLTLAALFVVGMLTGTKVDAANAEITSAEMKNAKVCTMNTNYAHTWGAGENSKAISKVTLKQNGVIKISATRIESKSFGLFSMNAAIYDTNGHLVWEGREDKKDAPKALYNVGLKSGTYYVQLQSEYSTGFAAGKTMDYKFNFSEKSNIELENNNTKETATKIKVNEKYTGYLGSGFSNTSKTADTIDVYKVSLKKGYTYKLDHTATEYTTIVGIYQKDEALNETFAKIKINARKEFVAPYSGDYWISVWNYRNQQYTYTLKLTATKVPCDATTITSLKPDKKAFKVSWKKKSGTGYEVQYSTKKNMSGAKKKIVNGSKTTNCSVKGLKKKQNYSVRVRTFITYCGKNYYSQWTKVQTVKTK